MEWMFGKDVCRDLLFQNAYGVRTLVFIWKHEREAWLTVIVWATHAFQLLLADPTIWIAYLDLPASLKRTDLSAGASEHPDNIPPSSLQVLARMPFGIGGSHESVKCGGSHRNGPFETGLASQITIWFRCHIDKNAVHDCLGSCVHAEYFSILK
jgi:hypothetical protein